MEANMESGNIRYIEAALAAPRPAKVEATRGDVLIGGPICRYMFI